MTMMDRIKAEEIATVNNAGEEDGWTYVAAPLTDTAGSLYVINVYDEDHVLVGTF